MQLALEIVTFILIVPGSIFVGLLLAFYAMERSDGKRAGRNGNTYRNEHKLRLLAHAYDRGFTRGEWLRFKGDSDKDRVQRNKERFGR